MLECILAVGILSIVIGSIIELQVSTMHILQISADKTNAVLALRSTMAQVEYVMNSKGLGGIPTQPATWVPEPKSKFQSIVKRTDLPKVKLSQFFLTAMKIKDVMQTESDTNLKLDADVAFASIMQILDSLFPTPLGSTNPNFANISAAVVWKDNKKERKVSENLFWINNELLEKVNLPSGFGAAPSKPL